MDCSPWWVLAAISAVTLVLHALLLAMLYVLLVRKIEQLHGGGEAGGRTAAEAALAPAVVPAEDAASRAAYTGGSDTSSETSEDSDSSPSVRERQVPRSEQSLNYSSLRFTALGRAPATSADYENMKTGLDYVNVDPKKQKADLWACSSTAKATEYTEVKL